MKSNKIILGMSALLVLSYSALNIASADYKEVPEKIASTMLGGAVCQCGGPNIRIVEQMHYRKARSAKQPKKNVLI